MRMSDERRLLPLRFDIRAPTQQKYAAVFNAEKLLVNTRKKAAAAKKNAEASENTRHDGEKPTSLTIKTRERATPAGCVRSIRCRFYARSQFFSSSLGRAR